MRNLNRQILMAAAVLAVGASGVALADDNSMTPYYGDSWARLGNPSNYESVYANPNRVLIAPTPRYVYRTYIYTYSTPPVYGTPRVYIVEEPVYRPFYGFTPSYNFPDSIVSQNSRFRDNTGE